MGKIHYDLAVYEDRLGVGSRIRELSGRSLSEKTTIYLAFLNLHKLKRAICSNAEKKKKLTSKILDFLYSLVSG